MGRSPAAFANGMKQLQSSTPRSISEVAEKDHA